MGKKLEYKSSESDVDSDDLETLLKKAQSETQKSYSKEMLQKMKQFDDEFEIARESTQQEIFSN